LTFEVIDTGPGIPAAEIERLFMPFERGDATSQYDHGAGLGLTICRLLTQALGGSLEVDSEVGKGTRFIVKLFAPEVHSVEAPRVGLANVRGYRGARRTLLVTDDLPEQRALVVRLLAPLGFMIAEAGSGPEALRWLGMHTADAIIMDISMPEMDGYETGRLIRERQLSAAPIVLLSANAFADDRERATMIGCDDYLVKPLQVPLLLDKLASLMKLEWIVSTEPVEAPISASPVLPVPPASPESRLPLPEALRTKLKTLLDMGYVQGVIEQIDASVAELPELRNQLTSLRSLAQRFQLTELAHRLEPFFGDSHA
jgi:CheY-like chemotaxis protein